MCGEAGTLSVVIPHWCPIVVVCRLLIVCCLLFACCLPVACCLLFVCCFLFTCRLPIACRLACRLSSHVIVIWCCQWMMVLGVCGFSWCQAPMVICGWWCGHIVVSWSGGEVSLSLSMGWLLTIPQRPCQHWAHLLSDCCPGAANKVSEVGAMTTGCSLTFPSAHVTYMAWALCLFAIMLALSSWGSKQG